MWNRITGLLNKLSRRPKEDPVYETLDIEFNTLLERRKELLK